MQGGLEPGSPPSQTRAQVLLAPFSSCEVGTVTSASRVPCEECRASALLQGRGLQCDAPQTGKGGPDWEEPAESATGREVGIQPGVQGPEWLGLRGTITLEGLGLNAHTQSRVPQRKGRVHASCPHLVRTMGPSALCRCHSDLYPRGLGDYPGSLL